MMKFEFPVGYLEFHKDNAINFQMNRWHSIGLARKEDFDSVAGKIEGFGDWKEAFIGLARDAESEGRLINAAVYYRAAEFFTYPSDPDKKSLYDRCITLFTEAYGNEPVKYDRIPYGKGFLPAMKITPAGKIKGKIILHGGYDSFMQEFYPVCTVFLEKGYEVYMFEGPGQGGALHECGMPMDFKWEEPVKAVLDYYSLEDVTLIGISLGGYLAPRAAAFEPRVKRVVMFDLIYDFYKSTTSRNPLVLKIVSEAMMTLGMKKAVNSLEKKIRSKSLFAEWFLVHGYYVYGVNNLFDYIKKQRLFSTIPINRLIKQDVLILAGADDIYTPYFERQKKALVNARSVEGRVFTREESASHHCQVGNLKIVADYILGWLSRVSD